VEAKAGVSDNDYSKNKWFDVSDMRRVYRFDAKTQRLEGFEAHLHRPGGDVLVAVIDRIEYDKPIDPKVFTLKLPDNVTWYKEPQRLVDNEKYEKMTPKEAAQAFFEACGRRDWKEAEKFYSHAGENTKGYLGGLKIVSLGEPFRSEKYPGWFVPYEIKLTTRVQFGDCYDNPAKRCIVFGPMARPDAKRLAQAKPLPDNEKYQKMTPKEAVQAFCNALEKKDAEEMWKFTDGSATVEEVKKEMAAPPMADFRVGEPTPAKEAGHWNVPVEIGVVRKHNLAVRNDNPAKRYVVDGGTP